MRIADEAESSTGRKVAWGARCGDEEKTFTALAVPVMTRLRMRERQTLDTLVGAGVARSRSDALAWCVRLVRDHEGEWIDQLRDALVAVEEARAAGRSPTPDAVAGRGRCDRLRRPGARRAVQDPGRLTILPAHVRGDARRVQRRPRLDAMCRTRIRALRRAFVVRRARDRRCAADPLRPRHRRAHVRRAVRRRVPRNGAAVAPALGSRAGPAVLHAAAPRGRRRSTCSGRVRTRDRSARSSRR